jgi:hypothetical protein
MNPLLAAAVIEFVGLCMFKEGDQKYPVHVVLPNVQQTSVPHHHPPVAQRGDIQLVQNRRRVFDPRQSVEQPRIITMDQHSAIIAWLGPPVAVEGWTPKTLKPVPQYQYVELKGEQIRIVGNGTSAYPEVPAVLPHVVKGSCSDSLVPNYAAKSAAIVLIEEGTLDACRPLINKERSTRIDTTLEVETTGPLVIETVTTPVKRLKLNAADLVVIGNVPTAWVNSAPDMAKSLHNEAGHYRGFYTVLARGGAGCAQQQVTAPECKRDGPLFGVKAPDDPKATGGGTSRFATGDLNAPPQRFNTAYNVWREGAAPPPTPTPTPGACPNCFMTYACSNSQYP